LHGNARPQLAAIKDECESQSSPLRRGLISGECSDSNFARPRGPLKCELRDRRDTSNFVTLVQSLDLTFLSVLEAI